MKALILAAGYGTRLYPLTLDVPKPLIRIGKDYLIDLLVRKLNSAGISGITVISNDKFYSKFVKWSKAYPGVSVISDNTKTPEERLGAIGDVNFALDKTNIFDDILVLGGDNFFSWSLNDFCSFSVKHKNPVVGIYDLKDQKSAMRFGIVELNANAKIVDFQEKPKSPKTTLAATCIYFFPKDSLRFVKEYCAASKDQDTTGEYIKWLMKKTGVYSYLFEGTWLDIGHKDSLLQAQKIASGI
jgi:glucose-1-phosphate thymidylyltransferase